MTKCLKKIFENWGGIPFLYNYQPCNIPALFFFQGVRGVLFSFRVCFFFQKGVYLRLYLHKKMDNRIVSTAVLTLSRQQEEFLARYRTHEAQQAYFESYGLGVTPFFRGGGGSHGVIPPSPEPELPYDYEVEYLEVNQNSGLSYIDTGIIPTGENIYLRIEYILYSTLNSASSSIFYTTSDAYHEQYGLSRVSGSDTQLIYRYAGGLATLYNGVLGEFVKFEGLPGGESILNGTIRSMGLSTKISNSTSILLFPRSLSELAHLRIFSFFLSDNGIPLIDLIPVSMDGVGFMYDKVSGELFGVQGGGSFVIGPRKE